MKKAAVPLDGTAAWQSEKIGKEAVYRHSAAATTERIIRAASVMQITRTRMVFRCAFLLRELAISNDLLAMR